MRTKENQHLSKYYTNKKVREEIDKRLQKHSSLEAELGIDSTTKEIKKIARDQLELEQEIKKLDPVYWKDVFKVEKE